MGWGRGGAGNIEQAQAISQPPAQDVEAQNPDAQSIDDNPPTPSSQPQQYAYKGRGGAGNWYSPADLNTEGTFTSSTSSTSASATPTSATGTQDIELPTARTGRGGAGNFIWGNNSEKREAEERQRKEQEERMRERVTQDVESGLARPDGVYLAVGSEKRVDDPANILPVEAGL